MADADKGEAPKADARVDYIRARLLKALDNIKADRFQKAWTDPDNMYVVTLSD
jgi:hypothetical protein